MGIGQVGATIGSQTGSSMSADVLRLLLTLFKREPPRSFDGSANLLLDNHSTGDIGDADARLDDSHLFSQFNILLAALYHTGGDPPSYVYENYILIT